MAGDPFLTAGRTVNSLSRDWCTPPKYVKAVKEVFRGRIALDPCSNKWSIVRAETEFCLPGQDGLKEEWNFPTIYVNPPYGADRKNRTTIKHWLAKCADAFNRHHAEVLALVPVATNTRHWKDYVWGQATGVCFLYDTRLRFLVNGKDGGKGAPMACAMVYWGHDLDSFQEVFMKHGAVVNLQPLRGEPIAGRSSHKMPQLFEDL